MIQKQREVCRLNIKGGCTSDLNFTDQMLRTAGFYEDDTISITVNNVALYLQWTEL